MIFYIQDGQIYCAKCRNELLLNKGLTEEEEKLKPSDFRSMGERPWGDDEDPPYRYIQCDNCLQQFGPDA